MTHTDALFANQSQSILDDLVAFFGSELPLELLGPERRDLRYEGLAKIVKRAPAMSATWGNSEKIYSLGVLPPVTQSGHAISAERS